MNHKSFQIQRKLLVGILISSVLLLNGCSDESDVSKGIHDRISTTPAIPITPVVQDSIVLTPPKPGNFAATEVPIIMFHYVRSVNPAKDLLGYNLSINPASFEKILKYLSQQGYKTIHVEDLIKGPITGKSIILTFDDGYEDFYTTARPLLQKYGFTASEAIITGKMDGTTYMSPDQVKTIDSEGFEILSHTVNHPDLSIIKNQKPEINDSKTYLEKLLNKPIDTLVYPSGKYNDETLQLTKDAGYKIGLTTKPGYSNLAGDLLQLNRIRIDNRNGYLGFVKKINNPN